MGGHCYDLQFDLLGKPGYFTGKRVTRTLGCSKPVMIYIGVLSLHFSHAHTHILVCLA